ncbi:MAG: hypothetical protein R3E79_04390 [Caldilineaceae bacterium]
MLASLFLSFTKYDIITRFQLIGVDNYTKLFSDDLWLTSVRVTLRYVGLFVPSALVTAYDCALDEPRMSRASTTIAPSGICRRLCRRWQAPPSGAGA